MIKTSIEELAEPIGFDIGNRDNAVQGKLLNGFCRGLYNSIPNKLDRERQYSYIVDKLDSKAIGVLSEITEFIKLRQSGL